MFILKKDNTNFWFYGKCSPHSLPNLIYREQNLSPNFKFLINFNFVLSTLKTFYWLSTSLVKYVQNFV